MEDDRRKSKRAVTKIEILFKELASFIKVYMLDVSNGGVFIKTDTPLPLDTPVFLRLKLPGDDEYLEIQGRVVWNNPTRRKNSFPRGMGIQFIEMSDQHAERIKSFVERFRGEIESTSLI